MKHERGTTLIELLIAITLVSLLMVGILYSLRVALNASERANAHFVSNRRVMGAQKALQQELANIMLVPADCGAPGTAGPALLTAPFFQGDPDTLRVVSTYSLQEAYRGNPRVLELHVMPGEQEGVRLVVNELVYAGSRSLAGICLGTVPDPQAGGLMPRFAPVAIGPQSFVLGDKLAYCRFSYKQEVPGTNPAQYRWVSRWNKAELPLAIHVEMAPLHVEPTELPLLSLTMPVHVNRNPKFPYADTY